MSAAASADRRLFARLKRLLPANAMTWSPAIPDPTTNGRHTGKVGRHQHRDGGTEDCPVTYSPHTTVVPGASHSATRCTKVWRTA
jgi:hypothetical protein